jgi:hypothetical protein
MEQYWAQAAQLDCESTQVDAAVVDAVVDTVVVTVVVAVVAAAVVELDEHAAQQYVVNGTLLMNDVALHLTPIYKIDPIRSDGKQKKVRIFRFEQMN